MGAPRAIHFIADSPDVSWLKRVTGACVFGRVRGAQSTCPCSSPTGARADRVSGVRACRGWRMHLFGACALAPGRLGHNLLLHGLCARSRHAFRVCVVVHGRASRNQLLQGPFGRMSVFRSVGRGLRARGAQSTSSRNVCLVQKSVQNVYCGPWARGARNQLLQGAPCGTCPCSERA